MLAYIAAGAAVLVVLAIASRSSASAAMPPCRTDLVAFQRDSRRRVRPNLIVLHSTEGPTAEGAAGWFTNPAAQGSTHMVVGEDGCFQTLPDEINATGAGTVNPRALQIEFAGYAAWSRAQWLQREQTLALGRAIVHSWARTYGIPLRRLSLDELRAGKAGVVTHGDVAKVFGGTRTDPGANFPIDRVLS